MFWLPLVLGAAISVAIAVIISKFISKDVDPKIAMAIRGFVVLLMVGSAVLVSGKFSGISSISMYSLFFIILSGAALAFARIFYFEALVNGGAGKVSAVNKLSAAFAIVMSAMFLGEGLTYATVLSAFLIIIGAMLMIHGDEKNRQKWLTFALISALFGAAYSVLGKPGSELVDPFLATGLRAIVFFSITLMVVYSSGLKINFGSINDSDKGLIILSGVFFGLSWLTLYYAITIGPAGAVSVLDQLSLPIIVIISYLLLNESMDRKSWLGILIMTIGILAPLLNYI